MSSPPPLISYRSGEVAGPGGRTSGQTLVAAGCYLFLIWCFYQAFWQFYDDHSGLFYWLDRSMVALGWNKLGSMPATVPFLRSASTTRIPAGFSTGGGFASGGSGASVGGFVAQEQLAPPFLTQLPFAAVFGLFVSAALFDWRVSRVRWLAAAFPVAAGIWRLLELVVNSVTYTAPAPRFGTSPVIFDMTYFGLVLLLLSIFLQAMVAYLAAWIGRPIAAWLAGLLLPRNLALSLQALWVR